ncbi:MAG: 5-(carboxyamino)imidazole ribonucleotide synthase [Alphaproteobacteria bacterium]|nr:5-(carboxyamino)imidazole ribonucleotide synthase [Alphaproteobacteria bacterium]
MSPSSLLPSHITLGILGGGQLGRMSAVAAVRLGIGVVIFCPEKDCPASYAAKETIAADYNDESALRDFSAKTDVISYEFENIPVETIEYLEFLKPGSVLPERSLLDVSQDRIKEKSFLNEHDIETVRWKTVSSLEDVEATCKEWGSKHFVIKTTRFGYDGKGQIKGECSDILDNRELIAFMENAKDQALIMEEFSAFDYEVSVIVARDKFGKTEFYGPMLNEHKNHILHTTTVPCGSSTGVIAQSRDIAERIANAVNLVGVLTIEFFVCNSDTLLVNEIAPRTHNSGHWSIDACAVSQFENHIRCVCGLNVGAPRRHSDAVMLNLIGNDIREIDDYLTRESACIHLYGKKDIKEGRKMGHITTLRNKT